MASSKSSHITNSMKHRNVIYIHGDGEWLKAQKEKWKNQNWIEYSIWKWKYLLQSWIHIVIVDYPSKCWFLILFYLEIECVISQWDTITKPQIVHYLSQIYRRKDFNFTQISSKLTLWINFFLISCSFQPNSTIYY